MTELERLLTDVVSRTVFSGWPLTFKLKDCAENLKTALKTEIKVGALDMKNSGVPLQICLVGFVEKWIVMVHLNKAGHSDPDGFRNQFVEAVEIVNDIEAAKLEKDVTRPAPAPPAPPAPPAGGGKASPPLPSSPHRRTRGPNKKTAALITEEVINGLLQAWKKICPDVSVIQQKEFKALFDSVLETEMSVKVIIGYLEVKGVIKLIPVPNKPKIELTESGIAQMKALDGPEQDGPDTEEAASPEDAPSLLIKVLPALQGALSLQDACLKLGESIALRMAAEEQIASLRQELTKLEEKLAKLRENEGAALVAVSRLVNPSGRDVLSELLEAIQKAKL